MPDERAQLALTRVHAPTYLRRLVAAAAAAICTCKHEEEVAATCIYKHGGEEAVVAFACRLGEGEEVTCSGKLAAAAAVETCACSDGVEVLHSEEVVIHSKEVASCDDGEEEEEVMVVEICVGSGALLVVGVMEEYRSS
ncbi:hypothetical protein Cni_G26508 [Canna indica]|uniref:Uncharacterized protein n=1 Tax=Canna indica TaxID=4628 RepID=A0AAQ3QRE7_9LILI|nr:hypothetical protein Cni_G26508 [Canna indica]